MKIKLRAPVKASSRSAGAAVTVKHLEITRGRDRGWARQSNVLYLTAYTSERRCEAGTESFELSLDYADARTLVQHLREELRLEREHEAIVRRRQS